MRLSVRATYGTRVLLDLAFNQGGGRVLLREISRRQGIPLAYLEHLISPLIATGMVRSVRGARGGIWLAKSPKDIKLSEVFRVLERPILVECVDNPEVCSRSQFCAIRDVWGEVRGAMERVLESVTLQDLAERQREKEKFKAEKDGKGSL